MWQSAWSLRHFEIKAIALSDLLIRRKPLSLLGSRSDLPIRRKPWISVILRTKNFHHRGGNFISLRESANSTLAEVPKPFRPEYSGWLTSRLDLRSAIFAREYSDYSPYSYPHPVLSTCSTAGSHTAQISHQARYTSGFESHQARFVLRKHFQQQYLSLKGTLNSPNPYYFMH